MNQMQILFLICFATANLLLTWFALRQCIKHKNAFGDTKFLYPLGVYVWGDQTIFGPFWTLSAIVSLLLSDWILFLLIFSVFWLVRSFGETMYWFHQQYSQKILNSPEKYWIYKIYKNKSVWFIYQIINQCMTIVTIITTIYLANLWLKQF